MAERDNIEQLFKENYAALYSLALTLLKDEDKARDAVHDVVVEILTSHSGDNLGKGYLVRSVRNRCINLLKEMTARERVGSLIPADFPYQDENSESQYEDYLSRLRQIIAGELPLQCSKIMRMRYEAGLSYQEIANSLGISKVAVYKHIKNGLDYIRKILEKP